MGAIVGRVSSFEYVIGESGELGYEVNQPDGTPMSLAGVGLRLIGHFPAGQTVIQGYATSGTIRRGGGTPFFHPSIAGFHLSTSNAPQTAGLYKLSFQINDGHGWRMMDEDLLTVRSL